jgi:hypothetical protein
VFKFLFQCDCALIYSSYTVGLKTTTLIRGKRWKILTHDDDDDVPFNLIIEQEHGDGSLS